MLMAIPAMLITSISDVTSIQSYKPFGATPTTEMPLSQHDSESGHDVPDLTSC